MKSVTIDILNNKVMKRLHDLENQQLIRLHNEGLDDRESIDWKTKYKGAMTSQSCIEVDKQLNDLRNEWE